ncbi:hypothetical protein FisN_2Lh249 [Fistulifera solaris]|uniref:Rhodanese domain-containing protein n=1 Tax=Fistulifera solaris TaxID=1519565 RepID=A0A1Z5KFA1_FISSO|nr:hypothetical protein FisN_2Lh249 [Fistulifera solaris]|eukprot:GAX24973.1 hypothetical protein FisN_2Lh249 [Fistulifera solaris]
MSAQMSNLIPSNQELVQQRLQVAREKRAARTRSIQQIQERNMHLKNILHSENNTTVPMYAVKVTVCDELRDELKLSGREKRGRVFIESESDAVRSLKGLRFELHAFFRALRKGSFLLSAGYPLVEEDGTISSSKTVDDVVWKIESDQDVIDTFQKADRFFQVNASTLKRPSIVIKVQKDPNAAPPPPPPAYLQNMPDPSSSPTITMLSFYSFPPGGVENPEDFANLLRKSWKPFQALGRIYVAKEGINAQMSVPTNILDNFMACCQSIPELGSYMENGINIDPIPLTREEFATAGTPAAGGEPAPPFTGLHVRVRRQIVADGLDEALDWQSAGYDMPPLEWHQKLKEEKDNLVLLDCRNTYETDVGRFEGAEPLGTENFRDSWAVLEDRLKDLPKDTPIYGYCTGGIRCVKVGAYVTQKMGFKNFTRLAGGIVAYDRTIQEEAPTEEPLFKGTNFVFDGRLGRPITEDSLGTCLTCGGETSLVSNCRNENCHKRMIQCENCRTSFLGTCSDACRHRLVRGTSVSITSRPEESKVSFKNLEDYSSGHSSPTPSVYKEVEFNTKSLIPSGSHMISGDAQGRLLAQLASMTREGRVMELGTFTGYSTICLIEGAGNVAKVMGQKGTRESGPFVLTMERDSRAFDVATAHVKAVAEHGLSEAGAESICSFREADVPSILSSTVSLVYEESVGVELRRVSDALAAVESIANGAEDDLSPFDLVFVDADKTRLLDYVEACLSNDRVLKKGGLIIVDNVLWKGLVLDASRNDSFSTASDNEDEEADEETAELRKNRRARKLANKMHRFNAAIAQDKRVEVLVIPVRDGLSVIRKK